MKTGILPGTAIVLIVLLSFSACKKTNSAGNNNPGSGSNDSATTIYASTLAGNSSASHFDYAPSGVAVDSKGNIYAAISGAAYLAKISNTGAINVFAGSKANFGCETGTGTAATFTNPYAIALDAAGNIYVADYLCSGIKRVSPAAVSSVFCQSDSYNNIFIAPQTLCLDPQGNVYSANQAASEGIAKTTPGGVVSHFAGANTTGYQDGPVATAQFAGLGITGLCSDAQGNIYVADPPRIRKISNGQVSTVAGNAAHGYADGKGTAASFGGAMGLCMGPDGNVYIADVYNNVIRKMTPDGTVTTISGTGTAGYKDGDPKVAQFDQPTNLCFDANGKLYIADYGNAMIRTITFPK